MAGKQNFTSEEWSRVVASPMTAGMAVTAADPSGLWGLLKEALSGGWALVEAKQAIGANPLAKAVADDMAVSETRTAARDWMQTQFKGAPLGEIKAKAVAELRAVAALVDAKAQDDAAGFKAWLLTVAEKAAEAGNEGGFLGFALVLIADDWRKDAALRSLVDDLTAENGEIATCIFEDVGRIGREQIAREHGDIGKEAGSEPPLHALPLLRECAMFGVGLQGLFDRDALAFVHHRPLPGFPREHSVEVRERVRVADRCVAARRRLQAEIKPGPERVAR